MGRSSFFGRVLLLSSFRLGRSERQMMDFLLVTAVILGIVIGRVYGWMKYHYPEFEEEMNLRVARKKAERVRWEAEAECYRGAIDDEIDRRISPPPKPSDARRSVTRP